MLVAEGEFLGMETKQSSLGSSVGLLRAPEEGRVPPNVLCPGQPSSRPNNDQLIRQHAEGAREQRPDHPSL